VSWDTVWETIHSRREWGKYPKEELVRFVARNYYAAPDRRAVRFLDLGCGFGASTWYLAREGFRVDAIDGAATAIERLRARLAAENLEASPATGDIAALAYPSESFDCVVDIACLMCNDAPSSRQILERVYAVMKPGGKLFSITATPACTGFGKGERVDEDTYRNVPEGPFAGTGTVRFSSEARIRNLYSRFGELKIDVSEYSSGGRAYTVSNWVIEGSKT